MKHESEHYVLFFRLAKEKSLVHHEVACPLRCTLKKKLPCFDCYSLWLHYSKLRQFSLGEQSSYVNPPFLSSSIQALLTSSGNQTPGWVLPSRTAKANAAVAKPTDLKNSNIACLDAVEAVFLMVTSNSVR